MLVSYLLLLFGVSAVSGQEYLTVTLCTFSGRPNPYCQIQHNDPKFQEIMNILPPPPGTPLKSVLGYQGFIVDHIATGRKTAVSVRAGSDRHLESVLFESCNFGLLEQFRNTLSGLIQGSTVG